MSATAIEHARGFAWAEGLRNVAFQRADAQVCRFPQQRFDLAISRFGTMFFNDPAAAFAKIRQALRPAGSSLPGKADPFSLANPPTVTEILKSGFADVAFTDVREPVRYGPDVASALGRVRGFACTSEVLNRLELAAAARALGRLRQALAAHLSDEVVRFNSRVWTVTARRY